MPEDGRPGQPRDPQAGEAPARPPFGEACSDTAPLRAAVLDGAFFGARHAEAAAQLAAFVAATGPDPLSTWFGADQACLLAVDPDRRRAALDRDIAAIDALLSEQVDAILHHPRLRRLEGSWRGLSWLADGLQAGGLQPGARVRLRLLNVGWPELVRDLERASEFDQSHLFRKIYEDEFGTPGGQPYGLLLVDHELRHRPGSAAGAGGVTATDDIGALKLLASIAAAAFVPIVLAASPALLELDAFGDLATVADRGALFRHDDYTRWRGLSNLEDARFVGIVLPRMLARPPRGDDPAGNVPFRYREVAPGAAERVWMSASYAFGHTVIRAFIDNAWPADIRGIDLDNRGGGLVDNLPIEGFSTDPEGTWARVPLDVVLTDRQERSLVDAGLMPLASLPYSNDAVFGAVGSLQTPQRYMGGNAATASANARLSARINTMLCVSRFAHYVKVIGRHMVGSVKTADEVERQLQSWLTTYVNTNTTAGPEMRRRSPLVQGSVEVRERPGRPGVYGCVMHLQPHFQLDDMAATFRLVTEITAPAAGRA